MPVTSVAWATRVYLLSVAILAERLPPALKVQKVALAESDVAGIKKGVLKLTLKL